MIFSDEYVMKFVSSRVIVLNIASRKTGYSTSPETENDDFLS